MTADNAADNAQTGIPLPRATVPRGSFVAESDKSSPIEKVFGLLEIMAQKGNPMGLRDLAAAMSLAKTTVHRITMQLERIGYIQREPGTSQLVVAPAMMNLAVNVLSASARQAERQAILKKLTEAIGESCCIGVRVGNEIVYLEDAIASGAVTLRFHRGLRAPLYCTSQGKLYLARMNSAEWRRFVNNTKFERFTEKTITDPHELRKIVDRVRKANFATSSEEFVRGIVGAAVPIVGENNKIYAALSFAAPASRSHKDLLRLRPVLEEAAAQLARTYLIRDKGTRRETEKFRVQRKRSRLSTLASTK